MVEGIISGLATTLILWVLGVAFWSSVAVPRRRRLQAFFGLSRATRTIGIYCSLLHVVSVAGNEPLRTGFSGPGMSRPEYLAAVSLRDSLLRHSRRWLGNVIAWKINIVIDTSPPGVATGPTLFPQQSLILMGSRVHNILTDKYLDRNPHSFFVWGRTPGGERTFLLRGEPERQFPHRRPPLDGESPADVVTHQQAVIERHYDAELKRSVVTLVGLGGLATAGAARYLQEKWEIYQRDIGKDRLAGDFAILLVFDGCRADLAITEDLSDIPAPRVLAVVDADRVRQPEPS